MSEMESRQRFLATHRSPEAREHYRIAHLGLHPAELAAAEQALQEHIPLAEQRRRTIASFPGLAPDYHDALTFHALPPAAGIGDIASTAKGSGARYNTGKPPLDLVPLVHIAAFHRSHRRRGDGQAAVEALDSLGRFQSQTGEAMAVLHELGDGWAECAQVFEYGRRKYAAWNWAKGMPWSAVISSAARHLLAMVDGELLDSESGLPHRGHVFCNIVMLLTYEETFTSGDDRPSEGLLTPVQE